MDQARFWIWSTLVIASLTAGSVYAAPGDSWNNQPSWTRGSSSNGSTSRKSKSVYSEANDNISPFVPGSNNLAIDVGQVFLMGDLSSRYNDSIGFQAHYTYGVSDLFGFDSSLGYSSHGDGAYSMTTLLTGLRTNLAWFDKAIPYFTFGLGFYKPDIRIGTGPTSSSVSPVVFGLHMGPGIDLEITRQLYFGAGLTFHDLFGTTRQVAGNSVDVGGTYTAFLLHAGVTF